MKPEIVQATEDVLAQHELLDELVAIRKSLGLSLRDVAERMGDYPATVRAIESEDSDPRLEELQRYARAIGCRITFIVERDFKSAPRNLKSEESS